MILVLDKAVGMDPIPTVPGGTWCLPKLIAKVWGKHWETLFLAPEQTGALKMEKMRVRRQTLGRGTPRITADPCATKDLPFIRHAHRNARTRVKASADRGCPPGTAARAARAFQSTRGRQGLPLSVNSAAVSAPWGARVGRVLAERWEPKMMSKELDPT